MNMERKDIEKLAEELRENMPEFSATGEEKEIKTALYLYVELGKRKSFDSKHYWADKDEIKRAIERKEIIDSRDINSVAKRRRVTCITMSHLYKELLAQFGIRACVERDVQQDANVLHMINTIFLKNGDEVTVDLQDDMYRIQTKRALKKFGIQNAKDSRKFSSEELTQMLMEMGYISDKEDYQDAKIEAVKKDIQGMDVASSIKFISNDERIYGGLENLGEVEADRYYKGIIATMFSGVERGKVSQIKCYKKTNEEEKYSFILFVKGKEPKFYIYSPKNKRLIECDIETLADLEDRGLQIGKKHKKGNEKTLDKLIKKERERKKKNNIGDESR